MSTESSHFVAEESSPERPLITLFVIAYNQEKYIAEAIKGALSQTYSPLEVILSDDNSVDGTFDVIRDAVASYRGPHRVLINQNCSNLGIAGHINRIMELASGELIVASGGDDISVKERVETTYRSWVDTGRRALSLYSGFAAIDIDGNHVGTRAFGYADEAINDISAFLLGQLHVFGATHAWHRSIFEKFGPISASVIAEDNIIPFRALLMGGKIKFINDVLVKYRQGGGVTTRFLSLPFRMQWETSQKYFREIRLRSVEGFLRDFEKAEVRSRDLEKLIEDELCLARLRFAIANKDNLISVLPLILRRRQEWWSITKDLFRFYMTTSWLSLRPKSK